MPIPPPLERILIRPWGTELAETRIRVWECIESVVGVPWRLALRCHGMGIAWDNLGIVASGGGGQTSKERAVWLAGVWYLKPYGIDLILGRVVTSFSGFFWCPEYGEWEGGRAWQCLITSFYFLAEYIQLSLSIQFPTSRIFHNHKENSKTGKQQGAQRATHHPLPNHVMPPTSNAQALLTPIPLTQPPICGRSTSSPNNFFTP